MSSVERGQIWWADLPEPRRSEPGYRRPVLVVQSDSFNYSRIQIVIVASLRRIWHLPLRLEMSFFLAARWDFGATQ